ncbi:MAG: nickel-dependent lactate racemase [Christensenellales bacterium]|jgi:nickel-dependent lactate racemase
MIYKIPYGDSTLSIDLPQEQVIYCALPNSPQTAPEPEGLTRAAFENPIGTPRLEDMLRAGMKVAILVDDATRPTPKRFLLPYVLERLKQAGIPDSDVKLVVCLGTHRPLTQGELVSSLGQEMLDRFKVVNHDYSDQSGYVSLGMTDSQIPVEILKEVAQCDFKIAIGNIVPHISAGWGGGAKMVQPGVCSEATTACTHIIACTKQNVLEVCANAENLCRHEIEKIAGMVGLDFIVNTVLDERNRILGVFCGHYIKAHRAGADFAGQVFCPKVPARADIVIASANPAQIDFWQGCKPYIYALYGLKPGGTLIFVIRAEEGLCGNAISHEETIKRFCRLPLEDVLEALESGEIEDLIGADTPIFLAQLREHGRVIVVSEGMTRQDAWYLCFDYAESLSQAVAEALERHGSRATIGIIPYAGETIVRPDKK